MSQDLLDELWDGADLSDSSGNVGGMFALQRFSSCLPILIDVSS